MGDRDPRRERAFRSWAFKYGCTWESPGGDLNSALTQPSLPGIPVYPGVGLQALQMILIFS